MTATNRTNGSKPRKSFPPGVHVPSLTWFHDTRDQEIDWDVQRKHLSFLIESGLDGSMFTTLVHFHCSKTDRIHPVVIAGTNGEAVTLSSSEKAQLVKTTRELAIELGRPKLTVTLGCGGGSTQQVIAEARLAKESGADFALVLVPSYFHFAMTEDAIITFFEEARIPLSSSGRGF
jgi:4-hydroxy-2-oxoglutarate aldolase